jgi:hypothetical protein
MNALPSANQAPAMAPLWRAVQQPRGPPEGHRNRAPVNQVNGRSASRAGRPPVQPATRRWRAGSRQRARQPRRVGLWRAQQGQGMPATSAGRSVAPSRPYGPTAGGLTPRAKGGHDASQMRHRATISALTYTCPPGTTPAQTCQSYRPSSPGSAASASAGSNTPWPISSKTPGHPAHLAGAGAPSGA